MIFSKLKFLCITVWQVNTAKVIHELAQIIMPVIQDDVQLHHPIVTPRLGTIP